MVGRKSSAIMRYPRGPTEETRAGDTLRGHPLSVRNSNKPISISNTQVGVEQVPPIQLSVNQIKRT